MNSIRQRSILLLAFVLLVFAMALAACGTPGATQSSGTSTTSQPATNQQVQPAQDTTQNSDQQVIDNAQKDVQNADSQAGQDNEQIP